MKEPKDLPVQIMKDAQTHKHKDKNIIDSIINKFMHHDEVLNALKNNNVTDISQLPPEKISNLLQTLNITEDHLKEHLNPHEAARAMELLKQAWNRQKNRNKTVSKTPNPIEKPNREQRTSKVYEKPSNEPSNLKIVGKKAPLNKRTIGTKPQNHGLSN